MIRLEGVGRAYGDRVVLRNVSAEVPAGATLAVFGANGAGKTTLLRIMAGLLRPHAGSVEVGGRVGLLAHDPLLYLDLTARENLRFHARLHRVAAARVEEVLEQVGMRDRGDEPVRYLSRGMTQRVAIARAVLHDPDVLLLDEPLANLDPGAARLVRPLLGRGTRVVISHDIDEGLREADLVLGLRGGRAALSGAATAEQVRELYA